MTATESWWWSTTRPGGHGSGTTTHAPHCPWRCMPSRRPACSVAPVCASSCTTCRRERCSRTSTRRSRCSARSLRPSRSPRTFAGPTAPMQRRGPGRHCSIRTCRRSARGATSGRTARRVSWSVRRSPTGRGWRPTPRRATARRMARSGHVRCERGLLSQEHRHADRLCPPKAVGEASTVTQTTDPDNAKPRAGSGHEQDGRPVTHLGTIVALANQKGGVAKTTSVASLGAAFAELGKRVLLVDLDAQACLTFSLGIDPDEVKVSINEVLVGRGVSARDVIVTCEDGFDLIPSTIELAGAEAQLLPRPGREYVLRSALEPVRGDYDVILVDCSPSLGVLTLNALTASQGLIIPMICEMLSHRGVGQLLDTVADVQSILNPELEVYGILPTLYDGRSNHTRAVLADVGERYGMPVLSPPIPKTVRFAEAPAVGRSILTTSRSSKGAQAYRDVAASLLSRL